MGSQSPRAKGQTRCPCSSCPSCPSSLFCLSFPSFLWEVWTRRYWARALRRRRWTRLPSSASSSPSSSVSSSSPAMPAPRVRIRRTPLAYTGSSSYDSVASPVGVPSLLNRSPSRKFSVHILYQCLLFHSRACRLDHGSWWMYLCSGATSSSQHARVLGYLVGAYTGRLLYVVRYMLFLCYDVDINF